MAPFSVRQSPTELIVYLVSRLVRLDRLAGVAGQSKRN